MSNNAQQVENYNFSNDFLGEKNSIFKITILTYILTRKKGKAFSCLIEHFQSNQELIISAPFRQFPHLKYSTRIRWKLDQKLKMN